MTRQPSRPGAAETRIAPWLARPFGLFGLFGLFGIACALWLVLDSLRVEAGFAAWGAVLPFGAGLSIWRSASQPESSRSELRGPALR